MWDEMRKNESNLLLAESRGVTRGFCLPLKKRVKSQGEAALNKNSLSYFL